ncbi:MAG: TIM barrel protein [Clostridia bacterium]|nr:TIM barrel protein [Clostridia bacterium]
MRDLAIFGPAGNEEAFKAAGYKSTLDTPAYLSEMGLDAYEYQCGRGVNITPETAFKLGEAAREKGIELSLHSPYYISMSGIDPEKRLGSIRYILESARAVSMMGGKRIVVHTGSVAKGVSREEALALASDTLSRALAALDDEKLDVTVCMETMGKINQLGTLDEVLSLCRVDERVLPCVDFGHLNARTHGSISGLCDYEQMYDRIADQIGSFRAANMHVHFSKIEYSAGGEVRHLTFEDETFGPNFEPFAEMLAKKGATPTVICESAGTQARDALSLKRAYLSLK